ncbi:MAG TPA: MFS transporter [Candidatus Sulfotelmatobacter sp.]|nr:MFS transporter [Candidatus Sulfotelmatobacter sp.]
MSVPAIRDESPPHTASATVAKPNPGMNRVLFLLCLSVLINYIDRSNLSIAAPLLKSELGISNTQLGTLLSIFFWIYALLQIPAGWLVDRFDVKWVFALGFFIWSASTAVTGLLHGFAALLVVRVVLGIGESVAFPSYSKILCGHFSEENRGFANGLLLCGLALGPAFGMFIGGNVVDRFGWRPFFLALGLIGLLWLGPWLAWMPRRSVPVELPAFPWSGWVPILRQRSAWGTALGQAAVNYCLYFLVTWLPAYLVRGRGLSMRAMAWNGGLLFLMYAIAATVCGRLSDHWISTGSSPTVIRKGSMCVGCTGLGICLALTAVVSDKALPWMLFITGTFLGIAACATWTIPQTLAGRTMVGRWVGWQNFVGNLGGAVAPFLTGYLLDHTGLYSWPFFITAAVAWLGAIAWTVMIGSIEEVKWKTALLDDCPPLASHT